MRGTGLIARLGEADVQLEVPEPQVQDSAAGPVHDEREEDDDEDYHHQPEEEHDDSGNCVPGYGSSSSHGLQLPVTAPIIRNPLYVYGTSPDGPAAASASQFLSPCSSGSPPGGIGNAICVPLDWGRHSSWNERRSRLPSLPRKRPGRWRRSAGAAGSQSGWTRS